MSLRHIRLRVVLTAVLLGLAVVTVTEKHVWQWAWASGPFAQRNYQAVVDANGRSVEAWRWVAGRHISVWVPANFTPERTTHMRDYVASLATDLGLPITVSVATAPPRVTDALAGATTTEKGRASVDFDQLCRLLVASRREAAADFVVAPACINRDRESAGAAYFSYGVAFLDAEIDGPVYARHETAHLLGYQIHDNWPITVFGYAAQRGGSNTGGSLMSATPDGDQLSERARGALLAFWGALPARLAQR